MAGARAWERQRQRQLAWGGMDVTTPQVRAAALTALGTTAYYAVPDVLTHRGSRAVAKTGIVVAMVTLLAGRKDLLQEAGISKDDLSELRSQWNRRTPKEKAVIAAVAAVSAAGGIALTVAGERAIYRRGERRRAAGKRGAHLRGALVLGALSAGMALIPPPQVPQES